MKIFIYILFICVVLFAENTIKNENILVDLRAVFVDYKYDNYWDDSKAFVTSVKLGYKRDIVPNLEAGVVFGAIEDFGLSDHDKQSMTYIYNRDTETFSILHQAYIKYELNKNYIQLGRFEFSSPLIDSDDYYVLSNSFEGITASINYKKLNFQAGHISKMSGSWDAGYDGGTFQSMSISPWLHKADNGETSQWPNPVADFGIDNSGISFASIMLSDEKYKFQLWDYYAHELMNSIYTQLDVKLDTFQISFQYNTFDEVGQFKEISDSRAIIDYSVWGAKVSSKIKDIDLTLAYTEVSDDESAHLWGSWGGFPYFASGMMVSYFETSLRDTHMYALNADVNFIDNLSTTFHIGYYDLNKNYTVDTHANRDAPDGEDYMYTYGIGNKYQINDDLSFVLKLAGRKLQTGNQSDLIRCIVKYTF